LGGLQGGESRSTGTSRQTEAQDEPSGRARIIAATKARWARVRKEKAAAEKQRTAKKTAPKLNARKPTRNGKKPSLVAAITPTAASARS